MGRRRKLGALLVAMALGATLLPRVAVAAGAYSIVTGGANPLNALRDYHLGTYVTADIDGDGDLDVVVRNWASDATIDVLRNDGGSFTLLTGAASPFAGISFPNDPLNFLNSRVLVGDFDADGDVDLWHHTTTSAEFYRNDGATFSVHVGAGDPLQALASRDHESYVVIDVDGDGDPDVVAREPTGDAGLELFRNDGGSFVLTSAPFTGVTFGAHAGNFLNSNVLVIDADRDGDLDLWHRGVGFTALYRNDGGTFTEVTGAADPLNVLAGYMPRTYLVADVDTDGDLDIVAREPMAGLSLDVLRNDPGGFTVLTGAASPFAAVTLPFAHIEASHVVVGDHDGDGDIDLYNHAVNHLYAQAGSAPQLVSMTPAHGATGVLVTSTLTMTFDEPVDLGVGAIVLRHGTTGALIERVGVGSTAAFAGMGTTTIAVTPTAPLPFATPVTVSVDAGAFVSSTDGDIFGGVQANAWRFESVAKAPPSLSGLDGDNVVFVEGDAPVRLDHGPPVGVIDADGLGFAGGTLSVGITNAVPGEDRLSIADATGVGTLTDGGSLLSIALHAGADASSVAALLRTVAYGNDAGDRPTAGSRLVGVSLTDARGDSATATVTVTVVAVNDPPVLTAPSGYVVTTGATVTVDGVTVIDVDDDMIRLVATTDIGAFGNGQRRVTFDGSPTDVTSALSAGQLEWLAPSTASNGVLQLTVDDGSAQSTASITVAVHSRPSSRPSTPPTSPILPPPDAWPPRAPWDEPLAPTSPRISADASESAASAPGPSSSPVADSAPAGGDDNSSVSAAAQSSDGRQIRDASPVSPVNQGGRSTAWVALVLGVVFLLALALWFRRRRDEDDRPAC